MQIVTKMSKGGHFNDPQKIYIFEFETQEEFDIYIDGMERFAKFGPLNEWMESVVNRAVTSLKYRCDNKYAHEGCAMSALLFQSEMEPLIEVLNVATAMTYRTLFPDDIKEEVKKS